MATLNPYLSFAGNCEEAFLFYKEVFGGEFQHLGRYDEMPESFKVPESDKQRILHVSLPITPDCTLMGSDIMESGIANFVVGNNFSISINTRTEAEARRIFSSLSEGGKIKMDLQVTFWKSLFGTLSDRFGVHWMVNHDMQKENT